MQERIRCAAALALALVFGACADGAQEGGGPAEGESDAQPAAGTTPGDLTARVTAQVQMMEGLSADSVQALLPMHRQMVANMLGQMNREMRDMNMGADASWTAMADSLREDLARMPELGPGDLQALMPGHHRRVRRLIEMHQGMMGRMRM